MDFEPGNAKPLDVLSSINYSDSALFGLSIDIFKVRLLITAIQSSQLERFGFEEDHAYLCCDFRKIENLKLDIRKPVFAPPYLEDGDLAAVDLADFDFECVDLRKVGATGLTDRYGGHGEMRDIHEIRLTFIGGGALQFQFASLEISVFDPIDFDR
jgi:hypothetical protein